MVKTKDPKRVKQGKKNRAAGQRFELKVRKYLESKGWVVDRWSNQVELYKENSIEVSGKLGGPFGKLIPAKSRFNMRTTGFPDFIAFRLVTFIAKVAKVDLPVYEILGIEVKSNGYLKPEEKEKCKWYLNNNIFSKILIASKGEKRGEIVYKEFEK